MRRMLSGRRGVALLAAVLALALVDALLAALWLWSRAEAREAAESLAASRAEWAAAAAESRALAWLAGQAVPLAADTALAPVVVAPGDTGFARLVAHGPGLVAIAVEARVPASPGVAARVVRCRWAAWTGAGRYALLGGGNCG
jgi:hypothetical protein